MCFSIIGVALCIGLSCGLCIFASGAVDSYNNIEDVFRKMDSIPEMMKKAQEKAYKEYTQQYGQGQQPEGAQA